MGNFTEQDFINIAEGALKSYLTGILAGDALSEVRTGFPNFTGMTPLQKVYVSVSYEESNFSASGYDNIVDVEKTAEGKVETRSHMVNAVFGVDVWSSRGDANNPSKAGGKTGAQRYFSVVARAFTTGEEDFYALHPDADIESFTHQYNRWPDSFDEADLYQIHAELRLSFPIEVL